MAINERAPVVGRSEIRIDAPAPVVWTVMSTIQDWPLWNPDIAAAELQGPLQPGSTFRWRSGPGEITSVLRDVQPGEVLEWTGSTFGIKAVHVWHIRPDGDGTVAATMESWEGLPARVLRGWSKRTLDAAIATGLAALKAEAERRAATAAR
jgi:hypothetical protein